MKEDKLTNDVLFQMNRRHFLTKASMSIGGVALASLLGPKKMFASSNSNLPSSGILGATHSTPKVKRVIHLVQSGGPSHLELFDYKPLLQKMNGEELPDSVRQGQRITGMTSNQKSFPLAGAQFDFSRKGKSGMMMGDLIPHIGDISDDLCLIKSMHTEAINHDPAMTFLQTGSQQSGRPAIGSWLSYGLGSDNNNLPTYCVLLPNSTGQPIPSRIWGNGFLPSIHQGVQFLPGESPVLHLNNPEGMHKSSRRAMLDHLKDIQKEEYNQFFDPEIQTRIGQYEMAYRMQASVPETMDISKEPDYIKEMYGSEVNKPGTYAASCLLARRLSERGVKYVQVFQKGWDHHSALPNGIKNMCKKVDQPTAALIKDLKQRGMLEDTLVIWGGEFGRTNYSQGKLTKTNYGRDHHPRCFTTMLAGAGVKSGYIHGQTDDFGYNIVKDPVHIHDFHATLLHLLGVDHEKLTFKSQGRRFRLTDVHGYIVKDILS